MGAWWLAWQRCLQRPVGRSGEGCCCKACTSSIALLPLQRAQAVGAAAGHDPGGQGGGARQRPLTQPRCAPCCCQLLALLVLLSRSGTNPQQLTPMPAPPPTCSLHVCVGVPAPRLPDSGRAPAGLLAGAAGLGPVWRLGVPGVAAVCGAARLEAAAPAAARQGRLTDAATPVKSRCVLLIAVPAGRLYCHPTSAPRQLDSSAGVTVRCRSRKEAQEEGRSKGDQRKGVGGSGGQGRRLLRQGGRPAPRRAAARQPAQPGRGLGCRCRRPAAAGWHPRGAAAGGRA